MLSSGLVVGIDVGSTKVCTLVGEVFLARDTIDVLGVGRAPCSGMARGVVEDAQLVRDAIRASLSAAEEAAGVQAQQALVSLSGIHLASQSEVGLWDLPGPALITEDHVAHLVSQGGTIHLPPGREVVHIEPQDFAVDGRRGLATPVGLTGQRLEAGLHIVTGSASARSQLDACLRAADVIPRRFVLQIVALGQACLTDDEREAGAVLANFGGGTTELGYFRRGALAYSAVVPVGGVTVTQDIVLCLGAEPGDAERLKITRGAATPELVPDQEVEFRSLSTGTLTTAPRRLLCEVIQARTEEILELARARLMRSGCLAGSSESLVLTGCGAQLIGLPDLARRIFGGMAVRLGRPRGVGLGIELVQDPSIHTALGLALRAAELAKGDIAARHTVSPLRRLMLALRDALGWRRRH